MNAYPDNYRQKKHLTLVQPQLTLIELWEKYTEHRKPLVAETTLKLKGLRYLVC